MKKVLIIGGGVAGLTAGIYAQKAGFSAEIYERHSLLGGECTGWDRDGYHIDNCIHRMMGTTRGTALYELWRTTGAFHNQTEFFYPQYLYRSRLGEDTITLWKDLARTEKELLALSPQDAEEIRQLVHICTIAQRWEFPCEKPPEFYGVSDLIKMTFTMGNILRGFQKYGSMSVGDLMERFRHPLIRCMLSEFFPPESMASNFFILYGNFIKGDGGIPAGGSRAMAQRMEARFRQSEGRYYAGIPVEKILVDGRRAAGIRLADNSVINGDYVLAACDPWHTFDKLLDNSYLPTRLGEIYENRADYPVFGAFQSAFSADCAQDSVGTDLYLDAEALRFAPWVSGRLCVKGYGYEPDFAPPGKQIIQTSLAMAEEGWDYWEELYHNKEAYRRRKAELTQSVLRLLEEHFPALEGKLTPLDSWTPLTYRQRLSAYKGNFLACTLTKQSSKGYYLDPVPKGLSNVLLTGQWLAPPGGLAAAAVEGKFAVQRLLHMEKRSIKI